MGFGATSSPPASGAFGSLVSTIASPQGQMGVSVGGATILDGAYANPNITFTRASNKSYINFDGVLTTATTNEWPVEYST